MIKAFHRPDTLDEALALKQQFAADAVWMAGGSRINAKGTDGKSSITSASIAISLDKLGLNQIESDPQATIIGATATLQSLIDHASVPAALQKAISLFFNRNLRNQSTLGGEIAIADPHSTILPALLSLHAELEIADGRCLSLERYLTERPEVLITKVRLPATVKACFSRKVANTSTAKPMVCVSVSLVGREGEADQLTVSLSGVGLVTLRLAATTEEDAIVQAVQEAIKPEVDFLGSAEAKSHLAGVITRRLVQKVTDPKNSDIK